MYYFVRDVKKKIWKKIKEKKYVMSKEEYVTDIYEILTHMEKYSRRHKHDVKKALNIVYEAKKDMIKCYL